MIFILLLAFATSSWGQPALFQPAPSHTVRVPVPAQSPTALNFDWADIPGATSYELEIERVGGSVERLVTDRSHALFSPLTTGSEAAPIMYEWSVRAYIDDQPGLASPPNAFGLAGAGSLVEFLLVPEGLSAPAALRTESQLLTFPFVQRGLFLEWDPVPNAVGYEVQLSVVESLRGQAINQLHYRMNVTEPSALVSNLLLLGNYRFEVRGIASGGVRGNPASGGFSLVESALDVNADLVVDTLDLLGLGLLWRNTTAEGDVVSNGRVDQNDMLALLIRLRRSTQEIPLPQVKAGPVSPKTSQKSLKTSWLQSLGGLLFGAPAYAVEVPKGSTIPAPKVIFPTCEQCGISSIEFLWTEVPGATHYEIDAFLRNIDGVFIPFGFPNTIDPIPGDGVVTTVQPVTLPGTFVFRVRAVVGDEPGPYSKRVPMTISADCVSPPEYPFIDMDYNDNREFDGADLLVFAAGWRSASGEASYRPLFDVEPAFSPNYEIDPNDLLRYFRLFRQRCIRPKSPRLGPPVQEVPLDRDLVIKPGFASFSVPFAWGPPPPSVFSEPGMYELEVLIPGFGESPARFFSLRTEKVIPFTPQGEYRWRIRAIADDGTVGRFSAYRTFFADIPENTVATPRLFSPTPQAVLSGGMVEFSWSRTAQVQPNSCRMDRLEISNGEVLSVSFDVYHTAEFIDSGTVSVKVPLYPNFGSDFTWRVRPFDEFTDDNNGVFQLGGVSTNQRRFTIDRERDPREIAGLAQWNPLQSDGTSYASPEFHVLSKGFRSIRSVSPENYDVNWDLNFDGFIGPKEDLFGVFHAGAGKLKFLRNGQGVPIPLGPVDRAFGAVPPLTPAGIARQGTIVTWFPPIQNGAINNLRTYLVEWIDADNHFRATYAIRIDPAVVLAPASDSVVNFATPEDTIVFSWEHREPVQEYNLFVDNIDSASLFVKHVLPDDPLQPTVSFTMTAADLIESTSSDGDDRFRFLVFPKACGHFTDQPAEFNFSITTDFDPSALPKGPPPPEADRNTDLKLPVLLTGSNRVFAPSFGLHHWRVTPVGEDFSTTGTPSRWQSFAVQTLRSQTAD